MAANEIPSVEIIFALLIPTTASNNAPNGIPIKNKPKLTSGPAAAICPFCLLCTLPATITAPGAMNKKPRRNANATPNLRLWGSARNSAQQP